MMPFLRRVSCQQFLGSNVSAATKRVYSKLFRRNVASWSSSSGKIEEAPDKKSRGLNEDVYGQATSGTHPHLINPGELVPGISVEEFQQRRERLLTGIQKYARDKFDVDHQNQMVIIPAASKKYMSGKIPYFFRQNTDFLYLTGCLEPNSVLMMTIDEHMTMTSTLFMQPKDKQSELWDGPRTGVQNALHLFGVDETYSLHEFGEEFFNRFNSDRPIVWYDLKNSDLAEISNNVRSTTGSATLVQSPEKFVQGMRLFKSAAEQNLMRQTCQIASEAVNELISESRPGMSEHHLHAMVDYKCRMRNASYLAYPPVVASGLNTTIIHYVNNTQLTKSGDMVLMDVGCEYAGYSSDITRSWPIDGRFTEVQKVLYDVVYDVQRELLDTLMREGGDTLDNLFETMCYKLGKLLQEVGLVPKSVSDARSYAQAGYKFCPHHVSHYLGMDVHDTPMMPRSLRIMPGMVFTVEPGIYIGHDRTDVPAEFRGIGVRIEDDVLVTNDYKLEVLTGRCARDRGALENIFKFKRTA